MKAAERERDETNKAAVLALVRDCDKRGERVTTAAQGSSTVYKLLSNMRDYPKGLGKDRLPDVLRVLESDGLLFRRTVRTPDRKYREVFTCKPEDDECAPIPQVEPHDQTPE